MRIEHLQSTTFPIRRIVPFSDYGAEGLGLLYETEKEGQVKYVRVYLREYGYDVPLNILFVDDPFGQDTIQFRRYARHGMFTSSIVEEVNLVKLHRNGPIVKDVRPSIEVLKDWIVD